MSVPNYHLTHITSFTIDLIGGEKSGGIQRISFTAQIRVTMLVSIHLRVDIQSAS